MMKNRDKAILEDLQKFRCLTRDDLIFLHFNHLKNSVTSCNTVMKRLTRDGHIDVDTTKTPYLYFPKPSSIKKTSQKIPHFLAITDVYKQLLPYEYPKSFDVEPKFGKEYMEPDIFTIWRRTPFFIEVQNSIYSTAVMKEKIARYEKYFYSQEWHNANWQGTNKKVFPTLLIITDRVYDVKSKNFKIFQAPSIHEFLSQVNK